MTRGMHELVEIIRDAVQAEDPEVIITGENCTENMIDVIDGTLQVTLWPENRKPLFAAVYQDYLVRYGTELITGAGYQGRYQNVWDQDAFFLECASMFVEGMQIGRIRLRPRDASLSFDKPEQKPMIDFLARVVGYYRQETARQCLAYGRLMPPLEFQAPSPLPTLRYTRGGEYPALMSGVFRTEAGELGVFVANAGREDIAWSAELERARYDVPEGIALDVDLISHEGNVQAGDRGVRGAVRLEGRLPGREIAMVHLRPAAK